MDLPASGFPPFVVSPHDALNPVARDGSGVTVRAVDSRTHAPVYLRIFSAQELADPQRQHSFVKLARTLIEADHPCFTRITHTGCENNFFYYAMSAADGELLADRMFSEPLSAAASVRVLDACLGALAVAQTYPGLVPRVLPGNVHVTGNPEQSRCTVRLILHHLIPARPPLEEPSYLPPESTLGEPPDTPGTIFSAGVLLQTLLSSTSGPVPQALFEAARRMTAAAPLRPPTLDASGRELREALTSPSPTAAPARPETPAIPAPAPPAPAVQDLDAIGRLTLELTRRAQAELHLTSQISALETRLRESETGKRRLETEISGLRVSLESAAASAAASNAVPPVSGHPADSQETHIREPQTLERRKRYELAPPWVLWFALGTLAVLMLAALYLLFQTLNESRPTERAPRRTPDLQEAVETAAQPAANPNPALHLVHLEALELIRKKDWAGILAVLQSLQSARPEGIRPSEIRFLAATLAADLESSSRHVPSIASEHGFRQLHEYLTSVQTQPEPVP